MSNKKFAFILVGLLSLLALFSSFSLMVKRQQPTEEKDINASIYNTKVSGYRGWYKTMGLAGISNTVWRHDFTQLKHIKKPSTLVIIQPKEYITHPGEGYQKTITLKGLDTLLKWVSEGGHTLVFLVDFVESIGYDLLKKLSLGDVWKGNQGSEKASPQYEVKIPAKSSFRLKRYISKPLVTRSQTRIEREKTASPQISSHQTLLTDENGYPLIEKYGLGKGAVIIGTMADLASNRYLLDTDNDNLQFFTNLLLLEHKPLYINEFVHGYLQNPDLFSYYQKTPLTPMLYQLIFLFILLLWLSFKPWRPIHDLSKEPGEVSLKSFVQSMAGIYLKANATSLALGPQLVTIEQTLRRRYRIETSIQDLGPSLEPETKKLQDLLESLSPKGQNPKAFFQGLQKARAIVNQRQKIPSKELVKLAQLLTLMQERLDYGIPPLTQTH